MGGNRCRRRRSDELPLTHKFLSLILGVQRSARCLVCLVDGQPVCLGLSEDKRPEVIYGWAGSILRVRLDCRELVRGRRSGGHGLGPNWVTL